MTQDIPAGRTKEEIKAREQLIKDFYARWIAEHPDKKVFNKALGKYICVKFLKYSHKTKPSAPKSDGLYVWGSKRPVGHKGCHPFCEFPYLTLQR